MTVAHSTILIVDDIQDVRDLLVLLLRQPDRHLLVAANGGDALAQAFAHRPDLILLDVMMPRMDGFEVCRRLRANPHTADVPILMLTALDDHKSRMQGIEAGADDFITKPCNNAELRARVSTILRLNRYRRLMNEQAKFERMFAHAPDGIAIVNAAGSIMLANSALVGLTCAADAAQLGGQPLLDLVAPHDWQRCYAALGLALADPTYRARVETALVRGDRPALEVELHIAHFMLDEQPAVQVLFRDISAQKSAERLIRTLNDDLLRAYDATLDGWVKAIDLRDKETEGHTRRVTAMTMRLARAMGVDEAKLVHMRRGALLHDIGKMGIPDHILLKPDPLTEMERTIIELHPRYAYEWLAPIDYLRPALDIPYYHHEKWDGTGYPRGLRGEAIPLAARIFAVVDVWDALRSDRPYRAALPDAVVERQIAALAGTHFDPHVAATFLRLLREDARQPTQEISVGAMVASVAEDREQGTGDRRQETGARAARLPTGENILEVEQEAFRDRSPTSGMFGC